ncbi:hypothetical protein ACFU99_01725 [Streptomyces sp. NPDC057654]|uniref:hypothetical protein n=1 Tax=Streptomyces sp. NPDC057654 TaxID=3346196 RepID=UPI0036C5FD37
MKLRASIVAYALVAGLIALAAPAGAAPAAEEKLYTCELIRKPHPNPYEPSYVSVKGWGCGVGGHDDLFVIYWPFRVTDGKTTYRCAKKQHSDYGRAGDDAQYVIGWLCRRV